MTELDEDPAYKIVRRKAVRWLSPRELTAAALRVALSSAFGAYSDKREIEQVFGSDKFDYSVAGNRDEVRPKTDPDCDDPLWVDYVSDTGDSFAATYAVAWTLAQDSLVVETDPDGETQELPRGHLLIHGGDLVYPTATSAEYEDRFTGPYKASLPYTDSHHPKFFAIPGNHDWYDGLTSFIRKFCDGKWLGGRQLPQKRSYFSIKLADNWWLWGIDIQFDGFIDTPQLDYFKQAATEMSPDAGVVVVTAKPSWALTDTDSTVRPTEEMHNLDFFLKDCLNCRAHFVDPTTATVRETPKANVRMMLAGDVHHYAHYLDRDNDVHYVTAGGGGAYLSLTHHLDEEVELHTKGVDDPDMITKTLSLQPAVFPSFEWSKRARWRGVFAGVYNPSFAVMMGIVYLIVAWLAQSSPGNIVLFVLFPLALVKFTRSASLTKATVVGGLHAAAHLGILIGALMLFRTVSDGSSWIVTWPLYLVGFSVLGVVVGSLIFGTYLAVADFLGLHPNDLNAAIRIEDKKNFLRMRVTADHIEVWALGLDEVPSATDWVPRDDDREFDEGLRLHSTEVEKLRIEDQMRLTNQRYKKAKQDERPDLVLSSDYGPGGKQFTHREIEYFKISRLAKPQ